MSLELTVRLTRIWWRRRIRFDWPWTSRRRGDGVRKKCATRKMKWPYNQVTWNMLLLLCKMCALFTATRKVLESKWICWQMCQQSRCTGECHLHSVRIKACARHDLSKANSNHVLNTCLKWRIYNWIIMLLKIVSKAKEKFLEARESCKFSSCIWEQPLAP